MSSRGASSDSCGEASADGGCQTYHTCWKKRHITRVLAQRGWVKEPSTKGPEACPDGGICYIQRVSGCKCGATWKLLPKAYVDCIGGKVSLAKLLVDNNITEVCPRTYFNYKTFCDAIDSGVVPNEGAKWFVKISHMNARRGVSCHNSADEARAYCTSLEVGKPAWFRYVIQEEVPRLHLHNGRKMLLRMWCLLTVHGGTGDIWLHINRRLRANAMRVGYDPNSSERDADVEHSTDNVFTSTADEWEHFDEVWQQCARTALKVVNAMVRLWGRRGLPPLLKEGTGQFNHLAFDFIPSESPEGSIRPYLLEVNVDPSFRNKCPETAGFARDIVDFFVETVGQGTPLVVPDDMFATVQVK